MNEKIQNVVKLLMVMMIALLAAAWCFIVLTDSRKINEMSDSYCSDFTITAIHPEGRILDKVDYTITMHDGHFVNKTITYTEQPKIGGENKITYKYSLDEPVPHCVSVTIDLDTAKAIGLAD